MCPLHGSTSPAICDVVAAHSAGDRSGHNVSCRRSAGCCCKSALHDSIASVIQRVTCSGHIALEICSAPATTLAAALVGARRAEQARNTHRGESAQAGTCIWCICSMTLLLNYLSTSQHHAVPVMNRPEASAAWRASHCCPVCGRPTAAAPAARAATGPATPSAAGTAQESHHRWAVCPAGCTKTPSAADVACLKLPPALNELEQALAAVQRWEAAASQYTRFLRILTGFLTSSAKQSAF